MFRINFIGCEILQHRLTSALVLFRQGNVDCKSLRDAVERLKHFARFSILKFSFPQEAWHHSPKA